MMGSPTWEPGRSSGERMHPVRLTRGIEMQATEVTQDQFQRLMGWNPSFFGGCGERCIADSASEYDEIDDVMVIYQNTGEIAFPMCFDPTELRSRECPGTCPVENVSWYTALAYTNELSREHGLPGCFVLEDIRCGDGTATGSDALACMSDEKLGIAHARVSLRQVGTVYDCTGFRIPTESEWEYAIRAESSTSIYPVEGTGGNLTTLGCAPPDPELDLIAWYGGNSEGRPHPVARKAPNAWGLHDMAGNVWEWVYDGYHHDYPTQSSVVPVEDPVCAIDTEERVERGGSWIQFATFCRSASRNAMAPGDGDPSLGFRTCRTLHR